MEQKTAGTRPAPRRMTGHALRTVILLWVGVLDAFLRNWKQNSRDASSAQKNDWPCIKDSYSSLGRGAGCVPAELE